MPQKKKKKTKMTKNNLVGKIQKNEEMMKEKNSVGKKTFQIKSENMFCRGQNIIFEKMVGEK